MYNKKLWNLNFVFSSISDSQPPFIHVSYSTYIYISVHSTYSSYTIGTQGLTGLPAPHWKFLDSFVRAWGGQDFESNFSDV